MRAAIECTPNKVSKPASSRPLAPRPNLSTGRQNPDASRAGCAFTIQSKLGIAKAYQDRVGLRRAVDEPPTNNYKVKLKWHLK